MSLKNSRWVGILGIGRNQWIDGIGQQPRLSTHCRPEPLFLYCFAKHSSSVSPFSLSSVCYQQRHYTITYAEDCEKIQGTNYLNFENDNEIRFQKIRESRSRSVTKTKIGQVERTTIKRCCIYLHTCYTSVMFDTMTNQTSTRERACLSIRATGSDSGNFCTSRATYRERLWYACRYHDATKSDGTENVENEVHRMVGRDDHFRDFVYLVIKSGRLPDR